MVGRIGTKGLEKALQCSTTIKETEILVEAQFLSSFLYKFSHQIQFLSSLFGDWVSSQPRLWLMFSGIRLTGTLVSPLNRFLFLVNLHKPLNNYLLPHIWILSCSDAS